LRRSWRLRVAEAEAARGNVRNAVALLSEIVAISDTSAATVARLRLPGPTRSSAIRRRRTARQQAMQVGIDELTEATS
jgi:hypothetical protein